MSIETKTYVFSNETFYVEGWNNFLTDLLNDYNWEEQSSVSDGPNSEWIGKIGKFYLNENGYLAFEWYSYRYGESFIRVRFVTGESSVTLYTSSQWSYKYITVGKTSKGLAILFKAENDILNLNSMQYNLYIGEIVNLDGSVTKGCIYLSDDNSHTICANSKTSSESTFTSVIDPTRKSFLVPVTDSTTGGVFKDIYLMANSPVQYNKLKIADTGNKYLCGKSICLAD